MNKDIKDEVSEFLQSLIDFMVKEMEIKTGNLDKDIGRAEIVRDIISYIKHKLLN